MSIDNVKRLENAMNKLCHWDKRMSDEDNQKIVNEGGRLLDEVSAENDVDVLGRMFDFLIIEKQDDVLMCGIGETLENGIFNNFTMEQIIEVLYKKFSMLIINNTMRAEAFAEACFNTGNFDNFRDIFNKTKSSKSAEFLDEFEETYGKDFPKEIAVLREDMKKW